MKNYYKLLICSVLLLIFLIFATSCNNGKPPIDDLTDTENITDSDSCEVTDTEEDLYGEPILEPYVPPLQEYSACTKWSFVVAEFGEPILPSNSSDGTTPILFKGHKAGEYAECFAYPIKILRKFEATAYSPDGDNKSYFRDMLEKWESSGDYRPQSRFNYSVDYQNKDEIMAEYDDIIMIDCYMDVAIGEQYCLSVYIMSIEHPDDPFETLRRAWTPMYDVVTMKPILISVKDDKICLPKEYYQKKPYPKEKEYVYTLAVLAEDANKKLVQLGLTDNLFRNGMTIDELDEYFNLVTKKETFAPLFEGAETE